MEVFVTNELVPLIQINISKKGISLDIYFASWEFA